MAMHVCMHVAMNVDRHVAVYGRPKSTSASLQFLSSIEAVASHLNPELVSVAGLVNQLAPRTPSLSPESWDCWLCWLCKGPGDWDYFHACMASIFMP